MTHPLRTVALVGLVVARVGASEGLQVTQSKWRVDATGTYVCAPLDATVTREEAMAGAWRPVFDEHGNYIGAVPKGGPDGPCHSSQEADAIDARPLPLCPPVDRSLSEQAANERREPSLRIKLDVHGRYEGVMHDTPDGPCRPRSEQDAATPPPPPRCHVFATASLIPRERALAIVGSDSLMWSDGPRGTERYMGSMLPVTCAVYEQATALMDALNAAAISSANRSAQQQEARDAALREALEAIDSRFEARALTDAVQAIGQELHCLNQWLIDWQRTKALHTPIPLPQMCR